MCLAVPMEILTVDGDSSATVRQGTGELQIDVSLLGDPKPGDYVIVHAGYAIEVLDMEDAEGRIEMFRELEEPADAG